MKKIKEIYRTKIIEDQNGFWRVIVGNNLDTISGQIPTRQMAEEYLQAHYEQAKQQWGDKYEVVLERVK